MAETTELLEQQEAVVQEEPADILPKKPDLSRFTRKKSKRKKRIVFLLVAVLLGGGVWYINSRPAGPTPMMYTELKRQTLANTVNLTGTVESAEVMRVYSTLQSTVQEVLVEVGDRVQAGDVLARLDTADLELSIAQKQAALSQAQRANEFAISVNEKKLTNTQKNIDQDLDANLIAAESALKSAQRDLNDARLDMQEHKDDMDHADDVMYAMEKALNRARDAFKTAEKNLKDAERELKNNGTPIPEAVKDAYNKAEAEYDAATREWNTANTEYGGELSTYSKNYRRARIAYENALANYEAAKNAAKQGLDSLADAVAQAEISADLTAEQIGLQILQKQRAESTLTAPISGTVTAVYAKVGLPGSGLMFVIEDTDALVIKTKVKEYDVAILEEGMPVTIKSDALGDDKPFDGEIQRIYPAAIKASDGSTQVGGSVEFETEVALLTQDSGLRVGMNVRMGVTTAQKDNVYYVPYEAIAQDADGNDIIYTGKENDEGVLVAEPVKVSTGLETDFYVEVEGDGLTDEMKVISDATVVQPGMPIMFITPGGAAALADVKAG